MIQEEQIIRLQLDDAKGQAAGGPRSGPPAESKLFVYRLRHARAIKLASTLQSVFGANASQSQAQTPPPAARTGVQLASLTGDTTRPALARSTGGTVSISATLHATVQIVSDESTNSLVIRAVESDYEIVRQAIEALDLRPRQVLIEVLIAEVRRSSSSTSG